MEKLEETSDINGIAHQTAVHDKKTAVHDKRRSPR
jgi:hypothetical protein